MEAHRADYDELDLGIVVISQGTPEVLRQFLARHPKPFPVVGDPSRTLYRAAGLDRVSVWGFFRPRVLAGYLRELRHGAKLTRPYAGEDVLQRGGDFVVTRDGGVVYTHRSPDSTSRPAVADVLAAGRPGGPE